MIRRLPALLFQGALVFTLLVFAGSCARVQNATYKVGLKKYETKSVVILPAVMGIFNDAAGVVEEQASVELQAWGIKVVDPDTVKGVRRADLFRIVDDVQSKGNASPVLSSSLGEKVGADTFVVTEVTAWSHRPEGKSSFAVVEIGFKLVDAATGKIVWQYTLEEEKEYWMVKPELKDISKGILAEIIKRMPKRER